MRPSQWSQDTAAEEKPTAASLPREEPFMHTQRDFNPFVIKVAPESSLQGFQIPYIEGLIDMEPGTLWGKFLLRRREGYAFSGPQVRACMRQQPGALSSKRAIQPLLATGLGKEAVFQCGVRMDNSSWPPFDKVAFTEDTLFSAAWSAQNRASPRGQRRVFTQTLQEMTSRSQPLQNRLKMSAVPHQHNLGDINVALVITIMFLIRWQDNMLPTRLLQSHNLVSTIAATGAFEKFQEEEPPMTREKNCSEMGRASLKTFGRPRWTGSERVGTPLLQQQEIDAMFPDGWCPTPAFSIEQASGKLRRIDDTKTSMSNRTASKKKGCNCTLHSDLQYTASWRLP